jgi:uncharacterized phage protein (TIGR02218 family)
MRTLSAGLEAHLAGQAHTRCTMLRLDLRDGTSIGITDHDQDLTYTGVGGSLVYSAGSGILPSDVSLSVGLDADNYEVTGPIGDVVTLPGILGKRFNRARARLFVVNWSDLTQGHAAIMWGKVSTARVEGDRFVLEVRSAVDAYNQTIGRVMTPICTADFGDAQCKMTRTEFVTTVTAAASNFLFTVDITGMPDISFAYGDVAFNSGALAGGDEIEIFSFDPDTGVVELLAPLADVPEAGDDLALYNGCSKLRMADDITVPTCLGYDNVINFRGWPEVPGSDIYLKQPVPGGTG